MYYRFFYIEGKFELNLVIILIKDSWRILFLITSYFYLILFMVNLWTPLSIFIFFDKIIGICFAKGYLKYHLSYLI